MEGKETWLSRHITLHDQCDPKEERENSITHAIGSALSLAFLMFVLFSRSSFERRETWIGMVVYGCMLALLYMSSTLYHFLPKGDAKRVFRVLDHANIYLLIAGTYTPILLSIGSADASRLLVFIWSVGLVGIAFSIVFWDRLKALHVVLYLVMGWIIIFFWNDIVPFLPAGLTGWILAAGVTYSSGVVFYALKRMPHHHMVWHIFCVAASALFCIGFLLHLR